ncbi:hypothetical protein ACHAQJ_005238 [Trichoderma viride]
MSVLQQQPTSSPLDKAIPETQNSEEKNPSIWHQVAIIGAAFVINFTSCGILFCFGIYQASYESMSTAGGPKNPFSGASSAEIDLIGSLSISLMTILAPFAVAWAKHFNSQVVVCAGGVIYGLALVLASFGKALWHFQLAQGLLLGIGTCLSFMPSMTVAPSWFGARRGLAMGIISAGTGIGGLVWAPIITACIDNLGYRNSLRLTGALSAALIFAAGLVLRWEPAMAAQLQADTIAMSKRKRFFQIPLPGWHMAKQSKFIALALGAALLSAAYYTPVFFLAAYARTLGYSEKEGTNFISISNACNAIGKIAVGMVADRLGRLNSFLLVTFVAAMVTLGLWVPSTVTGQNDELVGRRLFISFTVLYGLFASAYVSLFPAALVELFGLKQVPYVSGVMYMVQGMGALVGTPVAGTLVRGGGTPTSDDYLGMSFFVGALFLVASGIVAWVRIEAARGDAENSTTVEKRNWKR